MNSRPVVREIEVRPREAIDVLKQPPKLVKRSSPTPVELEPVLQSIMNYGRKTNAMGVLKASKELRSFAKCLRDETEKSASQLPNDFCIKLRALAQSADDKATHIENQLQTAYEAEEL